MRRLAANTRLVHAHVSACSFARSFARSFADSPFRPSDRQIDVNAVIKEDETPLMIACRMGHSSLIDMLMKDLKANVDQGNDDGRTALMRAAFCKQVKAVTTLINKYKAKVDAEDNWGATALFFAIQEGHVDVVNALAGTFKANVEHGKKSKGERPLMTAALMGSVDIVNLLCSRHKANVDGQNARGQTALMYACEEGKADIVQALAGRHKARVDIRCSKGLMALHYAAINGRHEIVDMLIGKYGANVEAVTTEDKWTALHYAADGGSLSTVKVLVNKYDANTRAVDAFGTTPLDYANENSEQDIIKVLSDESFVVYVKAKQAGSRDRADRADRAEKEAAEGNENKADVRLRINASTKVQRVCDVFCEKKGWSTEDVVFSFRGKPLVITRATTIGDLGLKRNDFIEASLNKSPEALHKAVEENNIAEIKRIGALKAFDLNAMLEGDSGPTSLMLAISCESIQAIRALMGVGADVEAVNERGWTPLMVAAYNNAPNIVVMLLDEFKARREAVDYDKGWTALFHAVDGDSIEALKVLVGRGASVTATDKEGKTPLDRAQEKGSKTMIELLDHAKKNPVRAGDESPDAVVAGGGSSGQSSPSEEAKRAAAERERELEVEREEKERARKKREEDIARKLAEEEEALNKKFAEEARKRAVEEAEQAKQRAIVEEAQRKAAAEEKARIEATKAQKRAEEEERLRKLEEEEAARHKRYVAEKKAREKEEKALRKQKKREAELEAKERLKALAKEKKEEQTKAKAGPPRVLVRPSDAKPVSDSSVNPTCPVEALIKYAEEGNMLNVTSLINHQNVDVNAKHPKTGITAVMAAARMGRVSTVKSLVKKYAKIEAVDNEGRTALMHAILGNQPAMVKDLLDSFRAETSVKDSSGETPMSMARNLGLDAIIELLTAHEERATQKRGKRTSPVKPTVKSADTARNRPVRPEPLPVKTAERSDRDDRGGSRHFGDLGDLGDLAGLGGSRHFGGLGGLDGLGGLGGLDGLGDIRQSRESLDDATFVPPRHHVDAMGAQAGGFFGNLDAGVLGESRDRALEDGLDAPPEEDLQATADAYDPIASGRDEWRQQSMFDVGLDIDTGVDLVDDVMVGLLKDIDYELNEANDEILDLVREDVPLPFSNVGLGGMLASVPAPADNPTSGLFENMEAGGLFGPLLLPQSGQGEQQAVGARPTGPMTAQDVEARLRKPPGFDHSPSKSVAQINMDARDRYQSSEDQERDREREEKLEKKFKAIRKERDELKKQLKNHDKRLTEYEKRMKSMEGKIDKLLALLE